MGITKALQGTSWIMSCAGVPPLKESLVASALRPCNTPVTLAAANPTAEQTDYNFNADFTAQKPLLTGFSIAVLQGFNSVFYLLIQR